jgi:hypothetical protein
VGALALSLPALLVHGRGAIAAVWLLWLVAAVVLFVNAAYRDGTIAQPYPRAIGTALRCMNPLGVVIAAVAIHALWLRVEQYGFTVARFWGFAVAVAALLYTLGYARASRDREHWMRRIAVVNVVVALYMVAVCTLALTPVLSPYRISANSQFAKALAPAGGPTAKTAYGMTPQMEYLRFSAGRYGRERLEELSRAVNSPRADEIRREAAATRARTARSEPPPQYERSSLFTEMTIRPEGHDVDLQLADLVTEDARRGGPYLGSAAQMAGVFVDLDGDRVEEFVWLAYTREHLYRYDGDSWRRSGDMARSELPKPGVIAEQLRSDGFRVEPSPWRDLVIGEVRYRVRPDAR